MANITFGDGVLSIGNYAFQNYQLLDGIALPNSLTTLGFVVFSGCTKITDVNGDGNVSIADVTTLIDQLLSGN